MKSRTADEKFLIELYKAAQVNGDPYLGIDYRRIARAQNLRETAVKTIVKHLAQANFIKKVDETMLIVTTHGCNFVIDELSVD